MKKYIVITILIFGSTIASGQKLQPEKMIVQFVIDLFNDEVQPQKIIDSYLDIKTNNENILSIAKRRETVVGIINKTRDGESKKFGWFIPDYKIKNLKKHKIYPLKKYENLDTLRIKSKTKYMDNIYVLLDPKKKKVLQYFLLNETNDKIVSFSLFIKSDQAWFFSY